MPFNLQAALGYSQFLQLNKIIEKKRNIFKWYSNCFKNIDVKLNTDNKEMFNGCWATTLIIGKSYKTDANSLMKYLESKNLPVRPFFAPLSNMKPFKQKTNNINAKNLFQKGITLPSALNLNQNHIKYYSENIINHLTSKI